MKRDRLSILTGQSKMEGHAKVESIDYRGDDPATAPLLNMTVDGGKIGPEVTFAEATLEMMKKK